MSDSILTPRPVNTFVPAPGTKEAERLAWKKAQAEITAASLLTPDEIEGIVKFDLWWLLGR